MVRRIRDGKIVRPGNRPAGDFDALSELSEQTLSRVQYYAQRTQDGSGVIGEQGDAAEFVAEEKFLNDLGYSVDEYEMYSGVEIQDGNDDSMEIDHLVVHKDTGKVVALGETKSEGSVDNFDEATDQLKEDTEFISQSELDIINVDRGPRGQSHLASNVKFPDSPAEDLDRLFAFGPGTQYDSRSVSITPSGIDRSVETVRLPSERTLRLLAEISNRFAGRISPRSVSPTQADLSGDTAGTRYPTVEAVRATTLRRTSGSGAAGIRVSTTPDITAATSRQSESTVDTSIKEVDL